MAIVGLGGTSIPQVEDLIGLLEDTVGKDEPLENTAESGVDPYADMLDKLLEAGISPMAVLTLIKNGGPKLQLSDEQMKVIETVPEGHADPVGEKGDKGI